MTQFVKRRRQSLDEEVEDAPSSPLNYGPLITAMKLYRITGLHTANQLKSIAKQLTESKKEWMKRSRDGYAIRGGGSAVAAGAAILGMFVAGPAFFASMLVGTVVAVGGQLALTDADRKNSNHETGFTKRIQMLYEELEREIQNVQETTRNLVHADTTDSKVLDELLSNITADKSIVGADRLPELYVMEAVVNNLRHLEQNIDVGRLQELRGYLGNLWHFVAPLIGFEGANLTEGLQRHITPVCNHSAYAICDSKPAKPTHFNCYSAFGKFLYVFGIAVNIANSTVSVMEVSNLQKKLKQMSSMTEEEQVEEIGGLADEIHGKGQVMQDRINAIFENLSEM